MSHAEPLRCPWASWVYPLSRHPQWLIDKVLDGVCKAGSRIQVPLMTSKYPIYHSSSFFPPSHATHNSVLISNAFKLVFFLQWCVGNSLLETCISTKTLSSMGDFLRQCSPETLASLLRGTVAGSLATSESTDETKVCMTIAWCMGEWDSSWVSWQIVLDTTALTKMLLSVNGSQIVVFWGGLQMRNILFSHVANITLWDLLSIFCVPGSVLGTNDKIISHFHLPMNLKVAWTNFYVYTIVDWSIKQFCKSSFALAPS